MNYNGNSGSSDYRIHDYDDGNYDDYDAYGAYDNYDDYDDYDDEGGHISMLRPLTRTDLTSNMMTNIARGRTDP